MNSIVNFAKSVYAAAALTVCVIYLGLTGRMNELS